MLRHRMTLQHFTNTSCSLIHCCTFSDVHSSCGPVNQYRHLPTVVNSTFTLPVSSSKASHPTVVVQNKTVEKNSKFAQKNNTYSCVLDDRLHCLGDLPVQKIDQINPRLSIDCPTLINNVTDLEIPGSVRSPVSIDVPAAKQIAVEMPTVGVEKLANAKLRRRRRSMRKHQRKRMIARIWPQIRKRNFQKRQIRQKQMLAYREKFRKLAEEFDAMEYITKNLKVAQDKGYYINIFEAKVKGQ